MENRILKPGQLETRLSAWNLKKEAAIQRFRAKPAWQQEEEEKAGSQSVDVEPHESLDRLCGDWHVFQLKKGHRFSLDDIACSWRAANAMPHARRLLDLGCGIGSVGLSTLHKLADPGLRRRILFCPHDRHFLTVDVLPQTRRWWGSRHKRSASPFLKRRWYITICRTV